MVPEVSFKFTPAWAPTVALFAGLVVPPTLLKSRAFPALKITLPALSRTVRPRVKTLSALIKPVTILSAVIVFCTIKLPEMYVLNSIHADPLNL